MPSNPKPSHVKSQALALPKRRSTALDVVRPAARRDRANERLRRELASKKLECETIFASLLEERRVAEDLAAVVAKAPRDVMDPKARGLREGVHDPFIIEHEVDRIAVNVMQVDICIGNLDALLFKAKASGWTPAPDDQRVWDETRSCATIERRRATRGLRDLRTELLELSAKLKVTHYAAVAALRGAIMSPPPKVTP